MILAFLGLLSPTVRAVGSALLVAIATCVILDIFLLIVTSVLQAAMFLQLVRQSSAVSALLQIAFCVLLIQFVLNVRLAMRQELVIAVH